MNIKKKFISAVMAATMVFSTSTFTAFADEWVSVSNGYKYQLDDGSYAKKGWLTVDGNKYYIKSNGFRAKGMIKITETVNKTKTTNYYYFDEDGVMQTGWQEINGKTYYFKKNTGARVTNKKIVIGSYSYKFDKNGVWTGVVYSKDGKTNVTKKVDVEKLTSNTTTTSTSTTSKTTTTTKTTTTSNKTTSTTEKAPATVTIKGKVYNTQATNTYKDPVYPKGATGDGAGSNKQSKWEFDISGCTDKDLECLKYFTNLEKLTLKCYDINNLPKITNLDFCQYMPNLKRVTVKYAVNLKNIDGLSTCKKLNYIYFFCVPVINLDALTDLTKITEVKCSYTHLDNVDGLKNCANLKTAWFNCSRLTDISGLANKNKLTSVYLAGNRRLKDITPLTTCENLKRLTLNSCTSVNTWSALKEMKSLTYVSLFYNVTGKEGPYGVAEQLSKAGVTAEYTSTAMREGTHNMTKELAGDAAWDASYRPEKVYGDDIECPAGCKECEYFGGISSKME